VGQWYKEISIKEEKSELINGGGKTWQLSIVEKKPKNILKEVNRHGNIHGCYNIYS
jgi:hypothetical protein